MCSNIPASPAYGVHISQFIRYYRAYGSYQDFLDRGLLLTRKLLNQGFLLIKLKSSLHAKVLRSPPWLGWPHMEYLCHKWPQICSTCPHSWLITGFVTRLTRRVPLVEQELLTFPPEHLSSHPVLSGVRVTRSLVLCVCFVDRCLSFCTFSLGHCVATSVLIRYMDSDYPFNLVSSNSSYHVYSY
jgi:hypothetical protein